MRVFEFESYKTYVVSRIDALPQKGRGQFRKIATHLSVHSTMVSQIFRGEKNLSSEQACLLSEYFGLGELESDYFLALVERERAGSVRLKKVINRRLNQIKTQGQQVKNRLPRSQALGEEAKAIFYSQWYYSGVRLLSSLPDHGDRETIASALRLSPKIVGRVVEFLLASGLCEEKEGKLSTSSLRTHIGSESPLAFRHHSNWRLKVMERFPSLSDSELSFTAPLTIARKDAPQVREAISELIEKVGKIVEKTTPEKLSCLNIDWVDIAPY